MALDTKESRGWHVFLHLSRLVVPGKPGQPEVCGHVPRTESISEGKCLILRRRRSRRRPSTAASPPHPRPDSKAAVTRLSLSAVQTGTTAQVASPCLHLCFDQTDSKCTRFPPVCRQSGPKQTAGCVFPTCMFSQDGGNQE